MKKFNEGNEWKRKEHTTQNEQKKQQQQKICWKSRDIKFFRFFFL